MKRWIPMALAVAALFLTPRRETDVSELLPVELIYIQQLGNQICVQTDTGDAGYGSTLEGALGDLKAAAAGKVFLETADYLIVTAETERYLPQLWNILRPATEVCLGIGVDANGAEYLSTHRPGVTLNDVRAGYGQLPTLRKTEGRYHLEQKCDIR